MKRDMELVIGVLEEIENRSEEELISEVHFPEVNDELVQYHINLMIDAGLIDGKCQLTSDGRHCFVRGLTWYGHDLLDENK